jgi:hypothetical protein
LLFEQRVKRLKNYTLYPMKTVLRSLLSLMAICAVQMGMANNIQVNNIALVNQNTTAGLNNAANHTFVQFDLTWDNSWRISAGPANYDAAWIFVKFQVFGSPEWQHATLSSTDAHHTIANNNGTAMTIDAAANGRGLIVHRTNNGTGNINLTGMQLRWNYRSGSAIHDTANVTVRVFALEMVFIPEGQFFIGDGTLTTPSPSTSAFRTNNVGNNRPVLVNAENVTFNFLNGSTASGTVPFAYNPQDARAFSLNANFPLGFAAFYTMKYELSVQQYVDFFNCLRTDITTAKNNRNITSGQPSRCTFGWSGSPLTDATPGVGANRPQGNFSWQDFYAYADWSGMRPMSEFEFEKINRGCDRTGASPGVAVYPVNGEYAWGENTNLLSVTSTVHLVNDGTVSEGIVSTSPNINVVTGFSSGPIRCGIFASKNATSNQRRESGGSYFGVMELTGSLEEYAVQPTRFLNPSSCTSTPYDFTNTMHGDGIIDQSTGQGNSPFLILNDVNMPFALSRRGGAYNTARRVSERYAPGISSPASSCSGWNSPRATRNPTAGFRGVISNNQF